MSKIVIIGSNHAGTAAVNTILDNYKDHEVIVFDKNDNISFLGCGMALWIGGQIQDGNTLFYANKEAHESKGAKVYMQTEVKDIDFDKKIVHATTADGSTIDQPYDKLIFATGSIPIIPTLPGSDLENIQKVKLYQDAQIVIDKIKDPSIKNVAVIGAGYIGVELAEAFERTNKKTRLFDIAPTCLVNYYDEEFTKLMDKNLEDHGIELHYNQAVVKFEGSNGKVEKIVTDKGEYPCDMAVVCIGFKPNSVIGGDKIDRFKNGAYLVNTKQETSIKDVYAIGDCASLLDNAIQDKSYIALATNAVRSGIVGAHNAAGTAIDSIGVQGSNGICIYDLKMVSTGLSESRAKKLGIDVETTSFKDLQKPGFIQGDNPEVAIKIVYEKSSRRVVGAQMASTYDMSMGIHMFSLAIQEKVTIDRIALLDIFFLPHFNQPYNYITMAALTAK